MLNCTNENSRVLSMSIVESDKLKTFDENECYCLTLAPMTRAPKINFGHTKVQSLVERQLLIINPQHFDVKLNVSFKDLVIDCMDLMIQKKSNIYLNIKWRPQAADNYKHTIIFEVPDNNRLKFPVHCYGECTGSVFQKPMIRKPLQSIQNLKMQNHGDSVTEKNKPIIKLSSGKENRNLLSLKTPRSSSNSRKPISGTSLHPVVKDKPVQKFLFESIYN